MKPEDGIEKLKKDYGDEFPAAVRLEGVRLPLVRETRFSRSYHSYEHKLGIEISRFMDGTASITAAELQSEWPTWDESQRLDFCNASCWLFEQADFPAMLEFIMQHGGPSDRSAIAGSVGHKLPQDQAFDILVRALNSSEIGETSNIGQAIAMTGHLKAEKVLREHLGVVWVNERLWDNDEFLNWVAFDAITCIAHLIELGATPADFESQVRRLSEHVCQGNRRSCSNFLGKHYPWLPPRKPLPQFGGS